MTTRQAQAAALPAALELRAAPPDKVAQAPQPAAAAVKVAGVARVARTASAPARHGNRSAASTATPTTLSAGQTAFPWTSPALANVPAMPGARAATSGVRPMPTLTGGVKAPRSNGCAVVAFGRIYFQRSGARVSPPVRFASVAPLVSSARASDPRYDCPAVVARTTAGVTPQRNGHGAARRARPPRPRHPKWATPLFCTPNAPAIMPAPAGAVVRLTVGGGMVCSCHEDAFSRWGWGRGGQRGGQCAGSAAGAQEAAGWWWCGACGGEWGGDRGKRPRRRALPLPSA
jgi:hypothetical protein